MSLCTYTYLAYVYVRVLQVRYSLNDSPWCSSGGTFSTCPKEFPIVWCILLEGSYCNLHLLGFATCPSWLRPAESAKLARDPESDIPFLWAGPKRGQAGSGAVGPLLVTVGGCSTLCLALVCQVA